jgi:superfamily II DNA or RNA helicase
LALKDLLFPHEINAAPIDVTRQYLIHAFANASKVWLVGTFEDVRQLADITWGLSGFRHQHADCLILLCFGNTEILLNSLKQNNLSQYVIKRLLWLEKFYTEKILQILTIDKHRTVLNDYLEKKFDSFLYFLAFADSDGTIVIFSRYRLPESSYNANVEFKITWSFGDPQKEVKRFEADIIELAKGADTSILSGHFTELFHTIVPGDELSEISWDEEFQDDQKKTVIDFKLYSHQEDAVRRWLETKYQGIFKICTGGGKTIAALSAIGYLANMSLIHQEKLPPVIITAPTRILSDQWIREIHRFGYRNVLKAYESVSNWFDILEPWLKANDGNQPRFVVSTYCTFADERFQNKLQRLSGQGIKAVWIADEMHNLASKRLLKLMAACSSLFPFRLGMSATPDIENDWDATEKLFTYFGGIIIDYKLEDGVRDGVLCPYRYYPIPSYLAPDVGMRYLNYLKDIEEVKPGSPAMLNLYRENRELVRTSGVQIAAFRNFLPQLLTGSEKFSHTLVYCPPGFIRFSEERDTFEDEDEERRLLEEVVDLLRENNLSCSSILGETPSLQRVEILKRFAIGEINALCAIGCLDEGVDVPAIHRAIVLYSIDRLKQFIQRRGRILRKGPGNPAKVAEIYDIVVLPQGSNLPVETAERLLKKELRRYEEFASMAINREEANKTLSDALFVACASQ